MGDICKGEAKTLLSVKKNHESSGVDLDSNNLNLDPVFLLNDKSRLGSGFRLSCFLPKTGNIEDKNSKLKEKPPSLQRDHPPLFKHGVSFFSCLGSSFCFVDSDPDPDPKHNE
jgi:hypothetical protein